MWRGQHRQRHHHGQHLAVAADRRRHFHHHPCRPDQADPLHRGAVQTVGGGSGAVTGRWSITSAARRPPATCSPPAAPSAARLLPAPSARTTTAMRCSCCCGTAWPTAKPPSPARGANADSDWSANKTIALPDLRGRVTAGKGQHGRHDRQPPHQRRQRYHRHHARRGGRHGDAYADGGTERAAESQSQPDSDIYQRRRQGDYGRAAADVSHADGYKRNRRGTSASSAHQNTQPTYIVNKIIKL